MWPVKEHFKLLTENTQNQKPKILIWSFRKFVKSRLDVMHNYLKNKNIL